MKDFKLEAIFLVGLSVVGWMGKRIAGVGGQFVTLLEACYSNCSILLSLDLAKKFSVMCVDGLWGWTVVIGGGCCLTGKLCKL